VDSLLPFLFYSNLNYLSPFRKHKLIDNQLFITLTHKGKRLIINVVEIHIFHFIELRIFWGRLITLFSHKKNATENSMTFQNV
jgi:hypothetical protein